MPTRIHEHARTHAHAYHTYHHRRLPHLCRRDEEDGGVHLWQVLDGPVERQLQHDAGRDVRHPASLGWRRQKSKGFPGRGLSSGFSGSRAQKGPERIKGCFLADARGGSKKERGGKGRPSRARRGRKGLTERSLNGGCFWMYCASSTGGTCMGGGTWEGAHGMGRMGEAQWAQGGVIHTFTHSHLHHG